MEFTTCLGLQSQTTRLLEGESCRPAYPADGALTLSDVPFQGTWAGREPDSASLDYNSTVAKDGRFSIWALPGSLAVTEGILVSFFSSA